MGDGYRRRLSSGARALRPHDALHALLLVGVLVAGLVVRVVNNDHGLPLVYNVDEADHFASRAVAMFDGNLDPGYYQNPSALTYLLFAALQVFYGGGNPLVELPYGTVPEQFQHDPTPIWVFARSLVVLLAMLGVAATYWVGRQLWERSVGLVAAALLTFAFLTVTYSRVAVTDVGTLLPVALALYGALRVYEHGGWRDYVLTGAAAGLAIGFKYTAGLVLLPLLLAFVVRFAGRGRDTPRAGEGIDDRW